MASPVEMPENAFSSASFDLGRYSSQNRLYGGLTQVRETADPRWVAKFTTARLTPVRLRAWRAFWDSLRGGLRSFVAYDPSQVFPLAYPNGFGGLTRAGGGAFDGTTIVTSLPAGNPFQVALGSLPAGFVLTAGDLVEIRQGERRGLFRLVGSASASGGGAVSLTVEPRINPALFTAAAVASFARPSCIMIPDPASWSFMAAARQSVPASFSGIQVLA